MCVCVALDDGDLSAANEATVNVVVIVVFDCCFCCYCYRY